MEDKYEIPDVRLKKKRVRKKGYGLKIVLMMALPLLLIKNIVVLVPEDRFVVVSNKRVYYNTDLREDMLERPYAEKRSLVLKLPWPLSSEKQMPALDIITERYSDDSYEVMKYRITEPLRYDKGGLENDLGPALSAIRTEDGDITDKLDAALSGKYGVDFISYEAVASKKIEDILDLEKKRIELAEEFIKRHAKGVLDGQGLTREEALELMKSYLGGRTIMEYNDNRGRKEEHIPVAY